MNDCQRYQDLIATYLAGEIGPADLEDLLAHSGQCEDCRSLVQLHRSFATMDTDLPEPSDEAFGAMRRRVLDELGQGRERAGVRPHLGRTLVDWISGYPMPAAAAVVLLLIGAGMAGRWSATPGWSDESLLSAVRVQAAQSTGLAGFWDAPFTFANVAVRQTNTGDLALGFDACRHVEAETSLNSPLAREILLATIIDSPVLGVRLKAMDMAPDLEDARLREALIFTLHNDPNLAVRLQALGALSRGPLDSATQAALLATLREDTAVQMRLLALEALAEQQVDPAAIRRAVSEAGQASDGVIMRHAVQVIGTS